jgi:hypothetical protein
VMPGLEQAPKSAVDTAGADGLPIAGERARGEGEKGWMFVLRDGEREGKGGEEEEGRGGKTINSLFFELDSTSPKKSINHLR